MANYSGKSMEKKMPMKKSGRKVKKAPKMKASKAMPFFGE